jgi:hypothetical protein
VCGIANAFGGVGDEHASISAVVISTETPAERQEATGICSDRLRPLLSASGLAAGP